MDELIISSVTLIGFLAVIAVGFGLLALIALFVWKLYRHVLSWRIYVDAMALYREKHPASE